MCIAADRMDWLKQIRIVRGDDVNRILRADLTY